MNAIQFAKQFTDIADAEIEVFLHSCKTILYFRDSAWVKKDNSDNFDIPMGSLHGAEACELVGLFLLNALKEIADPMDYGLYRDDGLIVVKKSACETERFSKSLRSTFARNGFNITLEKSLKRVEFFDVIMDLNQNSYRPYRKPNSETIYMSNQSNHPNYIKKQIPIMVNNRLNSLSKKKADFEFIKKNYQDALNKSSYKHELNYSEHCLHFFIKRTRESERKRRDGENNIFPAPPFPLGFNPKSADNF